MVERALLPHRLDIETEVAGPQDKIADRIFLLDYTREIEIGAYAEEVGVTQRVRFDVVLEVTRNTVWFDIFGALESFAKFPADWGGRTVVSPTQPNPCVPPAGAGTTLSTWAYSHEGYDEANDYFLPDVQVLSLNRYTDGQSGWQDNSGGVTFSDVTIEIYP